ncbi:MAG: class I SAM-dependent methyltransferase [Christensenellales bacterium]|jgi:hypothetical protein
MHYGVKLPDVDMLWEVAVRQTDGSLSERTANDDAERAFWKENMRNRQGYAPDAYSRPIAQAVCEMLQAHQVHDVLELGPGWGNYTLDIARIAESVTCVDISPDVISYILTVGRENGLHNISGVISKWEDFVPKRRYQAVFGYNCFYRMIPLSECLRKINETAQELCIMGMTSGPEQPFYREFEQVLGLKIRYNRLDYIYFINALYQMGIDVDVRILNLEKEYVYEDEETLLRAETGRIQSPEYDKDKVLSILRRYYRLQQDGNYHFVHKFKAAIISWQPVNLNRLWG